MKIEAFPDNIPIEIPETRELGFRKNFLDPRAGVSLNVDSITLSREGYERMHKWVYTEAGRTENPAATATSDGGVIYQMFLDISAESNFEIGFDEMNVGIDMRKSFGHFFRKMDSLTFSEIATRIDPATGLSFLHDSLGVRVPYVIIPYDLAMQQGLTTITTLLLFYQLYTVIMAIVKLASLAANPTNVGVIIIQVAANIIYFTAVVIELINAGKKLADLYFPSIKYLKAFSDFTLINQACKSEDYTLESSLLQFELSKLYTMGKPEARADQSVFELLFDEFFAVFNSGYPTSIDSTPKVGQLIDHILTTFDAKITVFDGIVRIERRSTFASQASIIVKPTLSDQENHDNKYTFNTDKDFRRAFDHWADDYQDKHSIEANRTMKSEHLTEQINVINKDLSNITKLRENAAPFAVAQRKTKLNKTENIIKNILQLIDKVVNTFLGNSDLTQNVKDRIGVVVIEQQYFGQTKKLWLDVSGGIGKQPSNYKSILSMDNIHNLFKTGLNMKENNRAEQAITVPWTDDNFISLLQNPFVIYEPTGEAVEVSDCTWKDRKFEADLLLLLPDGSAFNTKTTKLT